VLRSCNPRQFAQRSAVFARECVLIALGKRIALCPPKAEVTGSNPVGCASFSAIFCERYGTLVRASVRATFGCSPYVAEAFYE